MSLLFKTYPILARPCDLRRLRLIAVKFNPFRKKNIKIRLPEFLNLADSLLIQFRLHETLEKVFKLFQNNYLQRGFFIDNFTGSLNGFSGRSR